MIPIGIGLTYATYTLGLWGYCLVRGYNVPFTSMFGQTWPGTQVSQQAPAAGHQLGTITGNAQVTNPKQLASGG